MTLLESYRRNVERKQGEIVKLQEERAKAVCKISDLNDKISSLSSAMSRTKSESIIKMKLNEIQRREKELVGAHKKLSDIEKKLASKQKEFHSEQRKVADAEKRDNKKRLDEQKKQVKLQSESMKKLTKDVSSHNSRLSKLENLPKQISVLFLASNPNDTDRIRLDEEARAITEMIRKSEHRDSVALHTCWAVRPLDILQAVNEHNPTIIHFSGHGSDSGEIVLQDEVGNAKLVSKEAISQLLSASSSMIKLIFFNLCYSQIQAQHVVEYVPAAIGMTSSIGDYAAKIFAAQFYSSIGFGHSVHKAFEQGKAALMLESIPEEDIPELFIKDGINVEEMIIVKPPEQGVVS